MAAFDLHVAWRGAFHVGWTSRLGNGGRWRLEVAPQPLGSAPATALKFWRLAIVSDPSHSDRNSRYCLYTALSQLDEPPTAGGDWVQSDGF